MEEFEVTPESIKPYFKGTKKHKNYWKTVDEFYHMDFHFNGFFIPPIVNNGIATWDFNQDSPIADNPYFSRLIDQRRPSESDQIKAYRRIIYLPESKSPCFKVFNSQRKILKSPDWKIDYTHSEKPPSIADGEYLEDYCEHKYPKYGSVEGWAYNFGMKQMFIDANALIFVLPKSFEGNENEYLQPIATIINSRHVYGFKENEYAVFDVNRDYEYKSGDQMRKGKCLGIITKHGYWEARQVTKGDGEGFDLVRVGKFEMERLPAWIIGGVVKEDKQDYTLYDSFFSPMLPGLDGFAMAISDEDAEWVQHVYSTMWYFTNQDCNHCQGTGKVNSRGKQVVTCTVCKGQGNAPKSPYRDLILSAGKFDQQTMPAPPAGYIQKQTEIVTAFVERVEGKEYRALSSVNHEFLMEAPITQSGVAKQYDREELQNFTYAIAYHLVENVIKNIYYFINEFRYSEVVKDVKQRTEMLPKIPVPERYDLITGAVYEAQMKALMDAKADPEIIDAAEMQYISKSFPNNPELRERVSLKKKLDPFPRLSIDEKSTLSLDNSVDKVDIVLSNYLHSFIEQALYEHKDFCDKDLKAQKEIMYGYADEKMKKLDAAEKLKAKANAAIDPKTGQTYKP